MGARWRASDLKGGPSCGCGPGTTGWQINDARTGRAQAGDEGKGAAAHQQQPLRCRCCRRWRARARISTPPPPPPPSSAPCTCYPCPLPAPASVPRRPIAPSSDRTARPPAGSSTDCSPACAQGSRWYACTTPAADQHPATQTRSFTMACTARACARPLETGSDTISSRCNKTKRARRGHHSKAPQRARGPQQGGRRKRERCRRAAARGYEITPQITPQITSPRLSGISSMVVA